MALISLSPNDVAALAEAVEAQVLAELWAVDDAEGPEPDAIAGFVSDAVIEQVHAVLEAKTKRVARKRRVGRGQGSAPADAAKPRLTLTPTEPAEASK